MPYKKGVSSRRIFRLTNAVLAAARSRSGENNTQLFSYTLAPLRYVATYVEWKNGKLHRNQCPIKRASVRGEIVVLLPEGVATYVEWKKTAIYTEIKPFCRG